MTGPDSAPPSCTLWIDGVRYADGQPAELDGDPVALTGLRVIWGRDTTLDQPAPASCSFTVLDKPGGPRFTERLAIGARVQVRADATIYPDPTIPTVTDPGFEGQPAGSTPSTITSNATVTVTAGGRGGGQAAAVDPVDAARGVRVIFPPAPLSMDPSAWDTVPRTLAGQTWRYGAAVRAAAALVDVARVIVRPVTFTQPWAGSERVLNLAAAAGAPDPAGWSSYSATVTPPAGVWLGVAVDIFPTGPAWADLPADLAWDDVNVPALPGPPPAGSYTCSAFGDSITAGTWLPTYADSWIPKLETRLGISITNEAVGGAPLHDPGGGPVLLDQVTAALAGGPAPDVAVILCGTNDLMTHDESTLSQSAAAAQTVTDTLRAAGARVVWLSVLPMGRGTSHRDVDLPSLLNRRLFLNNQLRAFAGPGCWFDTQFLFGADAGGFVADPAWLLDGLHPTPAGASQMADQFPADTLNPAYTGPAPSWRDLARTLVDDLVVLAPAAGAGRAGEVFTGRITDLDAQWDAAAGGTAVDVTAQDDTAELANRYVGAEPWPAERLDTRFGRILAAAGQAMAAIVDPGPAARLISYRDVDNQASIGLLQSLAQSVGGALWSATSLTSGPYLRLEDVDARPPLLVLVMVDGVVVIVPADVLGDRGVTISACDVLLDPVHWQQNVGDVATRVAVGWRDQAPDPVKPTDRSVTAIDGPAEAARGRRRVQVSTELAVGADAAALASSLLARLSGDGWRIRGLTYRVELRDPLGPDGIALVMTILDATTRIGLPILLTDVPAWSPAPTRADVPLYLEGARLTNDAGAWAIELITSSAAAQGAAAVAWADLPADWSWVEFDPEIAWADLAGVGL